MRAANPSRELVLTVRKWLSKISPQQRDIQSLAVLPDRNVPRKHGREARNIVMPEDSFDLGQVRFAEKRSVSRRLEIHSANFQIERIFLWGDNQVGANG